MATSQGLFTGGVKIRNLNGYLIAVNGEVFATTNTGGTTYSFFYQAKTSITSGDPGSGHIIWNNATQTSATQVNVSHLTDVPVEDIDIYLTAIVPGNRLIIQDRDDSERFQIWTVSGAPTEIGSVYWTIPVTLVQSQGAAFTNNHDLLFAIVSGGSGGGGTTTNSITFNNGGFGAASGTSFNGGVPVTVSFNTIGAQAANANLTSLAGLSFATTAFVKMTGANTFTLDTNTYLTANQTITLTGNVTGSGTTSITTTIANNVVTNAMLAQIATARIKGRVTAGTGNVEDLTGTQATTLLDTFTSALKGLAPASGGGTTNFLRADGTWAVPAGGGGGTPAGSNTQIQYNNSGAFGASASFAWDNSTQSLNIGNGTAPAYITMLANGASSGWGGRIVADNTTGQFIFQHRNNSPTFITCWSLNANSGIGATYFYDRVFVTNNPGNSAVFIVNSTTDNGVDKLQVNGSMSVGSIKATGNVGIFNSSPFYALSVGDGTSTRQVVINGANSGTSGGSSVAVAANGLTTVMFGNKSNVTGGAYDGQPVFGFGGSTNSLQFYNFNTVNVPAMISSGDRFLIGTTTDNGVDKLQVSGSAIASTLKVNTSGQTLNISTFYNSGSGYNLWINNTAPATVSGDYNVGIGVDAMISNTSGYYNTGIGARALQRNTTGFSNVAIGFSALEYQTTGQRNVGIGLNALNSVVSGTDNFGIGAFALQFTTGSKNVAIGSQVMYENTSGSSNIALGLDAGRRISGGSANQTSNQSIFIGEDTRASAAGNTNEIVIGHNAIGQGSNSVTLGNSSITQTLLRGTVTGGSFVKSGGTNSQVLYADGSTKQITSGTAAPSGGNDGDIYLQYV
jgi:hypothetical protein